MKIKQAIMLLILFILLTGLPFSALAAESGGVLYDDNDFKKLQDFLILVSAEAMQTNGERINPNFDPDDPLTWTGVAWNDEVPKRVVSIGNGSSWYNKSLAGHLDLSGFAALTQVTCTKNSISSMNVSGSPALQSLYCYNNDMTVLTFNGNSGLTGLYCANNELTDLGLSDMPRLQWLLCGNNLLQTLNIASNTELMSLNCEANELTVIDIGQNTKLRSLNVSFNQLTELSVRSNALLTQISCSGNHIKELDVTQNLFLLSLNCAGNQLTDLDVSKNIELQTLDCSANVLTGLNITPNTDLIYLRCYENFISALDLSKNARLRELNCRENSLSSLDAAATAGLTIFDSTGNPLTFVSANLNGSVVTLNSNGSGFVELMRSRAGTVLTTASAVPHAGAVFLNWSETDGSVLTEMKLNLAANTAYNLTANFGAPEAEKPPVAAEAHTLSYHPNGATGNAPVDMNRYYAGDRVTLQNSEGLSKPGMVFIGWMTAEGEPVSDPFIMPDRDVTLFALWQESALPRIPKTGGIPSRIGPILMIADMVLIFAAVCIKRRRPDR